MKAPCCLLGAAALPRPPEHVRGTSRSGRAYGVPRVSYTHMLCVWWVVLVVVTRASAAGTDCPVRTDARDLASKAYVSPQVVEAAVREVGSTVPGQPYNVIVVVSKKLRPYNGQSRVKKRATLTLTFRHPLADTDSEISAENSDSDGECLVSAILKPRRKYLLFLSGPTERGAQPVPVAPPEPANKKNRRLVRKTLCKTCGVVTGGRGTDVVGFRPATVYLTSNLYNGFGDLATTSALPQTCDSPLVDWSPPPLKASNPSTGTLPVDTPLSP